MHIANRWMSLALFLALTVPAIAQRGTGAGNGATDPAAPVTVLPLSAEEEQWLVYMREEEKLARDVYLKLSKMWQLQVLDNIAASEQRHFDAIGILLERYGMKDPALEGEGRFSTGEFADLYDALILQGERSVNEALKVGITIEEMDIADLEEALATATHRDIFRVYNNLLDGSESHLRAFVSHLEVLGETYVPQHLDAATAADILAGSGRSFRSRNGARIGDGTCVRP